MSTKQLCVRMLLNVGYRAEGQMKPTGVVVCLQPCTARPAAPAVNAMDGRSNIN